MKKILAVLLVFLAGCSRDHDDLILPNVEDVTIVIVGDANETFTYAQTREFEVTSAGVKNVSISKPDGWKVSFENNKLTITSPDMTNTFAEKTGQISIVAAGEHGTSIATVKVNIFNSYTITFESADWGTFSSGSIQRGKMDGCGR